jgi:predicted 3-demethylubiquinone-9 3-methyltransferase (glyoxalase superfamily)
VANANWEDIDCLYCRKVSCRKRASTSYTPTACDSESSIVMTIVFELDGQKFVALNGGPHFKFNAAISFVVNCETQQEVDEYWEKLSAGGQIVECGWLTDKYGVSWQIVPTALVRLLQDKDPERSRRVMKAMLQMKKLDIAGRITDSCRENPTPRTRRVEDRRGYGGRGPFSKENSTLFFFNSLAPPLRQLRLGHNEV